MLDCLVCVGHEKMVCCKSRSPASGIYSNLPSGTQFSKEELDRIPTLRTSQDQTTPHATVAQTCNPVTCFSVSTSSWIIDSGASDHMTGNKDIQFMVSPSTRPLVKIVNGTNVPVEDIGSCARRLVEEKDWVHLYNGSKNFLTIIAVVIRTAFELKKGGNWKVLALVSSIVAILFNTYWDIVVDWGLLQRNSKNLFLRDKLAVSRRSVYFVVMVLDVILRLAWLQLVLKFNVPSLKGTAISSLFSCLEIFRRGVWMFFRLENEHLNNVGKYRAFKSVPLPFNYYNDEDDEENDNRKED